MDFPNENEIAEIGIREIVSTPGSQITVEVARTDATDANILIHASAAMADEAVSQTVDLESGVFLDSCTGKKLDRYLWDRYRLKRPGATPALNSIYFTTATAAAAAFAILNGTFVETPDGIQYMTVGASLYAAGLGAGTGIFVTARSVLAGSAQRSVASASNPLALSIVSQIDGAPVDLSASFLLSSSGGSDEMTDPEFQQIGRDFFATAMLGTLPALEARAKRVNGVKTARAFEALSATGRPERFVVIVISDAYTSTYATLSTTPPAYVAQSQLLALAVQEALADTRGAGMGVAVIMGAVVLMPISLSLRFVAGVDYNAVAYSARIALYNYTNSLSGGQTWSYAAASAALRAVPGLAWSGGEVTSPSGDVLAGPLQLLRTDMRLVQANNIASEQQLAGLNPDQLLLGT